MSEYPYESKIHSDDKLYNCTVYSYDGIRIGKVEAAFAESFIVKNEMEYKEIKYEIPRLDIASIINGSIALKIKKSMKHHISIKFGI
jgi:hypothetical protein